MNDAPGQNIRVRTGLFVVVVCRDKRKTKMLKGSADHQNFQGHTATNSLDPEANPVASRWGIES